MDCSFRVRIKRTAYQSLDLDVSDVVLLLSRKTTRVSTSAVIDELIVEIEFGKLGI